MNNIIKLLKQVDSYSYAGRFEVGTYLVELPNGQQTNFFLRKGNPYAIIVPMLDDSSFVMVKQYRLGAQQISLEFPMGEVAGKTHREAAEIELREETGYSATVYTHLGQFYLSPGWSTQEGHIYLASGLQEGRQDLEEYEFIESVVVNEKDLESMILRGEIIDASTLVAFQQYKNHIGKNA
ncbi:MAG: NUDIX hydrolase [Patescibacteria group bacterium]